jgi:hypothetical protein
MPLLSGPATAPATTAVAAPPTHAILRAVADWAVVAGFAAPGVAAGAPAETGVATMGSARAPRSPPSPRLARRGDAAPAPAPAPTAPWLLSATAKTSGDNVSGLWVACVRDGDSTGGRPKGRWPAGDTPGSPSTAPRAPPAPPASPAVAAAGVSNTPGECTMPTAGLGGVGSAARTRRGLRGGSWVGAHAGSSAQPLWPGGGTAAARGGKAGTMATGGTGAFRPVTRLNSPVSLTRVGGAERARGEGNATITTGAPMHLLWTQPLWPCLPPPPSPPTTAAAACGATRAPDSPHSVAKIKLAAGGARGGEHSAAPGAPKRSAPAPAPALTTSTPCATAVAPAVLPGMPRRPVQETPGRGHHPAQPRTNSNSWSMHAKGTGSAQLRLARGTSTQVRQPFGGKFVCLTGWCRRIECGLRVRPGAPSRRLTRLMAHRPIPAATLGQSATVAPVLPLPIPHGRALCIRPVTIAHTLPPRRHPDGCRSSWLALQQRGRRRCPLHVAGRAHARQLARGCQATACKPFPLAAAMSSQVSPSRCLPHRTVA